MPGKIGRPPVSDDKKLPYLNNKFQSLLKVIIKIVSMVPL